MHRDIIYEGTEAEKDAKALKDLKRWLHPKQWEIATTQPSRFGSKEEIEACMSLFCGVEGRPVGALIRKYHNDLPERPSEVR